VPLLIQTAAGTYFCLLYILVDYAKVRLEKTENKGSWRQYLTFETTDGPVAAAAVQSFDTTRKKYDKSFGACP
jgi:hypothetical protein